MGRKPTDFFLSANKVPPNNKAVILSGQFPASMMFIKMVSDERRVIPTSLQVIRSSMCLGRIPSGPPADTAEKERTMRITSPLVVWKASEFDGGSGGSDISIGGCILSSSSKDSESA